MSILERMKDILPVSRRRFMGTIQDMKQELSLELIQESARVNQENTRQLESLMTALNNQGSELRQINDVSKQILDNTKNLIDREAELSKEIKTLEVRITDIDKEQTVAAEKDKQLVTTLSNHYEVMKQTLNLIRATRRVAEENMWSNVFHDAQRESEWLQKTEFVPGRWAIGYQTLYVLYRVLNELHPNAILELGLGQSTKMITQYVDSNQGIMHQVVEHDQSWIDHYKATYFLAKDTNILLKELSSTSLNGCENIRCYKDFEEGISTNKYDLIIIDGPWGGDMQELSRVDVAKIMPECLAESFVIILDDYNRLGERNTLEYMKTVLDEHHIAYETAKYEGAKDMVVLTSADRSMVCTY